MADPFLGEIRMFCGNFAPIGWALCQGQLLSISQNTALFSILGTTFGGNGTTTFGLPDLRGRVPINFGQGPGLSSYNLGEMSGSENVTLLASQMPAHTHAVGAVTGNQGSTSHPNGQYLASSGSAVIYNSGPPDSAMNAGMNQSAGGSQPHSNIQPFLCVNFIIALQGIFPSRN
jgi:microcystin-dependent protein